MQITARRNLTDWKSVCFRRMKLQKFETEVSWQVAVALSWIFKTFIKSLATQMNLITANEDERQKLLRISRDSSSFLVEFLNFHADPTRAASQDDLENSHIDQPDTAGPSTYIMEDPKGARVDKNQNRLPVRHWSLAQPYISSAILQQGIGGLSLINIDWIIKCMDQYNEIEKDLKMLRTLTYFWSRREIYESLKLPVFKKIWEKL